MHHHQFKKQNMSITLIPFPHFSHQRNTQHVKNIKLIKLSVHRIYCLPKTQINVNIDSTKTTPALYKIKPINYPNPHHPNPINEHTKKKSINNVCHINALCKNNSMKIPLCTTQSSRRYFSTTKQIRSNHTRVQKSMQNIPTTT